MNFAPPTVVAVLGFSLAWLAIDANCILQATAGGVLFGGAVVYGLVGRW